MRIWVDADACPRAVKEILFRAAQRTATTVTLVANQLQSIPPSPHIKTVQVAAGFDIADNYIVQQLCAGDLVITADIPLAAEVVAKGAVAINPRGTQYTAENIRQKLSLRNFMQELRDTGQAHGGPPPLDQSDRQAFANTLDRLLSQWRNQPTVNKAHQR